MSAGLTRHAVTGHESHRDGDVNHSVTVARVGDGCQTYEVCYRGPDTQHVRTLNFAGAGQPGLTNEALLAVVADRLERFQAGPLACPENEAALASVRNALAALHDRTRRRVDQKVEGRAEPHVTADARVYLRSKDVLSVGGALFAVRSLEAWGAWEAVETEVRKFVTPLTPAEWAVLEACAKYGGESGLVEMKQSLARTARIARTP